MSDTEILRRAIAKTQREAHLKNGVVNAVGAIREELARYAASMGSNHYRPEWRNGLVDGLVFALAQLTGEDTESILEAARERAVEILEAKA